MTDDTSLKLDRRQLAKTLSLGAACAFFAGKAAAAEEDKANLLYLQLKDGRVVIRLRPDLAPKHVAQIKTLVKRGFYDGIVFHRVIEGFMAQTGDPTGTGTGGSDLPNIPAEFSPAPFGRGTLGMARSASPNSANSQFFICFAPAPFLDGKYTVWGEVISGMEFVDKIKRGEPPENPDKIISLKLATDA
jgi:cyclophilin family peptidyl-prolyl cis-trans isomerase